MWAAPVPPDTLDGNMCLGERRSLAVVDPQQMLASFLREQASVWIAQSTNGGSSLS
ncbi:MAG: hypothetical protein RJA99_989 [Pseudomonadota bacterium]